MCKYKNKSNSSSFGKTQPVQSPCLNCYKQKAPQQNFCPAMVLFPGLRRKYGPQLCFHAFFMLLPCP